MCLLVYCVSRGRLNKATHTWVLIVPAVPRSDSPNIGTASVYTGSLYASKAQLTFVDFLVFVFLPQRALLAHLY